MTRGRLRVYLGAAPGVGKTFAMLNEGNRRRERGTDVIVGAVETHGRAHTADQIGDLEVLAGRKVSGPRSAIAEMDVAAILARDPAVALIDDLAYTNSAGSRYERRWQDVEALLDAGIDVVSTLNIEHLASLSDVIEQITGRRQMQTVPDEVVRRADQVELVDMTPEALRRRLAHGNIISAEHASHAPIDYFRPGTLDALRELALMWVADRVEDTLTDYRREHEPNEKWETRERVVAAIAGTPSGENLLRRASRMAQRSHADLICVHVSKGGGRHGRKAMPLLDQHRRLVADLGGTFHELVAVDVADTLIRFAVEEHATQLVLGASRRSWATQFTSGSVINAVIRRAGPIDVHVISTDAPASRAPSRHRDRQRAGISVRRRLAGWAVAVGGTVGLTAMLVSEWGQIEQPSRFLLFQSVVLVAAATGGFGPAIGAAVLATGALNWYFTPPLGTWTIDDPQNAIAVVMFTIVGLLVAVLVNGLARSSVEAQRARKEAEDLASVAGSLAVAGDPLPGMLERIRIALDVDGVALYDGDDHTPLTMSGDGIDRSVSTSLPLNDATLVVAGHLTGEWRRVLATFVAQLNAALEQRRLRREAETAEAVAQADALRTALLRAVTHDLRTPLASIKASVTSLMQRDIEWVQEERDEFMSTIDEETDRLDHVVANLLDASRLEAGVISPTPQLTAIDDVTGVALASISGLRAHIDIDYANDLPLVLVDPGLLERAIANLVANAARVAEDADPVQIIARVLGERVELRIVDRGPGIPAMDRARIFEPFQRLGDSGVGGVGLGLTVAKGLIEAIGGTLAAEDTPGGGLTMVVSLPWVRP